ncbi:MAG: Uma2 family endonuclease [Moorea sp. SIO3I7]|uniref:Uma2 family endonuclease n=1 Tax=unclassified Moorena TaxID=2683338 RepID=UPI0013C0DB07|nr:MULTISPECIES: Uma2 family endonuclease [unclassified Moorena]NEN97391.1 Uma2 family endonuclease [Moorena sp. SIO3I7]NEO07385.1 Uma2 family endonuclease [Moorena sp. SIO3I8]NEO17557.1 Uma2 family endonuclease [Moorena sp. SIO3E8]NEO19414.1 Uma2 family endonuclease [Moorena sp. SIO4A5]NEP27013.1 Uma2 family endonuclease [Moorena sp. SIO3I6]
MVQQLHPTTDDIFYPESDGKPLADNTLQFELITTIKYGLEALFKDDPNVFVAGDLLWYPEQGQPKINQAPDVMVVLGRPKGHRRSYKTWVEDNINPQVVFEIASLTNTIKELEDDKLKFYRTHGVEEYYLYDPNRAKLKGWLRSAEKLEPIPQMLGWVSPRLGIRFELVGSDLVLYYPNGERFATYLEIIELKDLAQQQAEQERQRAEQAEEALEQAEEALELERLEKQQASQRAEQAEASLQALLEQLKAKGIDPEQFEL